MQIGNLRIPFILQEQASGDGGAWSDMGVVWGDIKNAMVAETDATHIAIMRAKEIGRLDTGRRIVWDERAFLIVRVDKVAEGPWWVRVALREMMFLG